MTSSRDDLLARIRRAVAEGNRAGVAPPLPARGDVGYQGGGSDLVNQFCAELTALGGHPHVVADIKGAAACVIDLIQLVPESGGAKTASRRVLVGRGPILDTLQLPQRLRERNHEVHVVDALAAGLERDVFFKADVGISGVAYAIAETGTLVMSASRADPRSLSLLPPVHIAVVGRSQLLPDLFDLFTELEPNKDRLPSCLSLISGPSKTGDIELKLVTGVHGPGELHVVVIE